MHIHICDAGSHYRFWCSDLPYDMFEVINKTPQTISLVEFLIRVAGDVFVEGFPEDDEGILYCKDCLREAQEMAALHEAKAIKPKHRRK